MAHNVKTFQISNGADTTLVTKSASDSNTIKVYRILLWNDDATTTVNVALNRNVSTGLVGWRNLEIGKTTLAPESSGSFNVSSQPVFLGTEFSTDSVSVQPDQNVTVMVTVWYNDDAASFSALDQSQTTSTSAQLLAQADGSPARIQSRFYNAGANPNTILLKYMSDDDSDMENTIVERTITAGSSTDFACYMDTNDEITYTASTSEDLTVFASYKQLPSE